MEEPNTTASKIAPTQNEDQTSSQLLYEAAEEQGCDSSKRELTCLPLSVLGGPYCNRVPHTDAPLTCSFTHRLSPVSRFLRNHDGCCRPLKECCALAHNRAASGLKAIAMVLKEHPTKTSTPSMLVRKLRCSSSSACRVCLSSRASEPPTCIYYT